MQMEMTFPEHQEEEELAQDVVEDVKPKPSKFQTQGDMKYIAKLTADQAFSCPVDDDQLFVAEAAFTKLQKRFKIHDHHVFFPHVENHPDYLPPDPWINPGPEIDRRMTDRPEQVPTLEKLQSMYS